MLPDTPTPTRPLTIAYVGTMRHRRRRGHHHAHMAGAQSKRSTCPQGHPYDLVSGGRRRCLRCKRERYQPVPRPTLAERLWRRIERDPSGCWLWVGNVGTNGYGRLLNQLAHRVVYELLVGPIPEAYVLDHLCRVRHCVNPSHLEVVTLAENVRRGAADRKAGR